MKNLKWFLGLALALSFLAWSAPKVLAATDLKTNLETAIKQLQSALNLLAANDVVAPTNGDFGYYAPAWERGQVLGETDTCAPPANGCGPDSWFDQTACACKSNNPPAAGGSAPSPDSGTNPSPTCLVNGVNMPGSCDQYPPNQGTKPYQGYQPQQGQPGQMMGPNQEPNNQDWEKQQAEQEKRMEEQRAKEEAQQLKRIKSDAARTLSDVKKMKTQLAKFKKAGLNTDALAAAISAIEIYANKMKSAATMSDLEELDMDPGEQFSTVSETMNFLSRQLELKQRMLPQLTRSVKPFQTAYNRLVKNKNIDQAVKDDFKGALDDVNAVIAQVQEAAKNAGNEDELENVFFLLDELPDKFNELGLKQQEAEFFANYKKGITGFNTMITKFTNAIKQADKKKLDTVDVKAQLADVKQLFNEVKTAANTKPVDIDDLMFRVSELSDLANYLNDALAELGVGVNNISMPQLSKQVNVQFNMPSSFNYNQQQPQQGPQVTPNNQDGGQPQGPQMAPGTF